MSTVAHMLSRAREELKSDRSAGKHAQTLAFLLLQVTE